ncbi:Uncharacterised protein [Escherichia coli]|uniref:Uncharacterized protein n=1 Tax=Escherichia coli TaxID=562 RepID=A0A377ALS6_ECOLX|nr:Uncharacterised protein [Escherichia coli]
MGRATKAMAKVASDCSVAAVGIALREEDMRKHNNGRSGVNVKVEELNGCAMREATRTLLRELIGVYSCSWSSVVAVACIIFSYFLANE